MKRLSLSLHFFAMLFLFISCEYTNTRGISTEGARAGSGSGHSSSSDSSSRSSGSSGEVRRPFIGGVSGSRARIAATASSMVGKRDCSTDPPPGLKCAVQASNILKAAGVPIKGSPLVNGVVSQLRRAGWKDGPCGPGAVRHSAGSSASGRHIGVIAKNGKPAHNGPRKDSRGRVCGEVHQGSYPAWRSGRGGCLVPPQ